MTTIGNLENRVYDDPRGTIGKAAQYVRDQRRHLRHLSEGSKRHETVKKAISRAETAIFHAARVVPDKTHHKTIHLPARMPRQTGCLAFFAR